MNPEAARCQVSVVSDERHEGCSAPADGAASERREPSAEGETSATARRGKEYWRSLDDFADTPEFREFMFREFPAGATEMLSTNERRNFLKIMGASMALAGLGAAAGGCRRWPEQHIAPYAYRPPEYAPGSTRQFATSMDIGGVAEALLVTSYDFRPIKIEGNPEHPINQGATDTYAQASILDLYDPDRSHFPLRNGQHSSWSDFTAWAATHFGGAAGGVAFLSEASSSPSLHAMRERLRQAMPNASWHEYEPLHNDNVVRGSMLAFGAPHRAQYAFDQATVVVSLESDFLRPSPASIKWIRDFANGRRAQDRRTMSRLYAFESTVTLTGANADHRVAMRSADVAVIAARIVAAVGQTSKRPNVQTSKDGEEVAGGDVDVSTFGRLDVSLPGVDAAKLNQTLEHLVQDLNQARGRSIVIAGPHQPAEVHYLVHLINQALGNIGTTIQFTPTQEVPHTESISDLARRMQNGQVQTLVILGGNPAYNAPADLDFEQLLRNVPHTIHLSDYVDETSQLCTWHINRAHYLEAWGDGRSYDGTITLAQPLIEPLFEGKSAIELLAVLSKDPLAAQPGVAGGLGQAIVHRTMQEMNVGGDWRRALHDGFIANTAWQPAAGRLQVNPQGLAQHVQALAQRQAASGGADQIEVVFTVDSSLYDGRFANNGWLQELPDPITKLTWDNAVIMSPSAAQSRGLKNGSMIRLRVGGREIEAPVMVLPGQFAGSVALALGYGRNIQTPEGPARIATGAGVNAYALRTSEAMNIASGTIAAAGGTYVLATTQEHHPIGTMGARGTQDRLPSLFREAALPEYQEDPKFAKHRAHVVHRLSLWDENHPYHHEGTRGPAQYAWAMSIDLSACTGCNACVIACQAENNIPIVGKEQVSKKREMHWLRIDRYFKGWNEEQPDAFIFGPVPCMHCENAPCEEVCPVAATTHDTDGLNVMVYNRCVGTRYCSNNCPYKVRRFNYFDYHRRLPHREQPGMLLQVQPDYYAKGQAAADPLRQLQFNPEVTVRMRGIMEKCTFCIQRIAHARIEAKNEWVRARNLDKDAELDVRVPIPDGSFTTACAQACPAQAIVFGDLRDPNSRVSQLHKHERTYEMLEELNTKPRTRYMAKIRNPAF